MQGRFSSSRQLLSRGYIGDNGKENGNYKDYRDYNRVFIGVYILLAASTDVFECSLDPSWSLDGMARVDLKFLESAPICSPFRRAYVHTYIYICAYTCAY